MDESSLGSIDEDARRRFEADWLSGSACPLEEYLPPENDTRYLATLEELIQIELEFGWRRAGQSSSSDARPGGPRIEEYLERFPALNHHPIVVRLVQQEWRVRRQYAETPDVDEYKHRFGETVVPSDVLDTVIKSAAVKSLEIDVTEPPKFIDRYAVTDELGRGGFGVVWRATDPKMGREVAVKQLSQRLAKDAGCRARFVNEARVSARLEHPGVVPVHDMGAPNDERPYYTMKSVHGQTLADAIKTFHQVEHTGSQRSIDFVRLLNAYLAVVRTMQYVHAQAVIHRDLKPQNILLGDFGETIVLDWGLAKVVQSHFGSQFSEGDFQPSERLDMTLEGTVQGTPAYMSPEQAEGRVQDVDERSDVYALGVILYQLLTNQLPFSGDSFEEVKQKIVASPLVSPRSINGRIPHALDAICRKAMARAPADRYPSSAELAQDMERYLADEPVLAAQEPTSVRLSRWMRKRRTVVAATASLLVVALLATSVIAVLQTLNNQALHAANEREREAFLRAIDRDEEMADLLLDANQLYDIGRPPAEAEAALKKSVSISRSLVDEFPDRERFALLLGRGYGNLGMVHRRMKKYQRAEDDYRQSIEVLSALTNRAPENAQYASDLAGKHGNLSALYLFMGDEKVTETALDDPEVLPEYIKALEAIQTSLKMRQSPPLAKETNLEYRYALASDYVNYGGVLRRFNRMEDAAAATMQSIQITKELLGATHHIDYVVLLGTAHVSLAQLYNQQEQHKQADHEYVRAIAFLGEEIERAPRESRLIRLYRIALQERAELLYRLGSFRESVEAFQRALQVASVSDAAAIQSRMLMAHVRASGHAAAVEMADKLAANSADNPATLFDAAMFYALAIQDVIHDDRLKVDERRALVEEYGAKSVQLLRQAERLGVFQDPVYLEQLASSDAFTPLHQREDYQALITDLTRQTDR